MSETFDASDPQARTAGIAAVKEAAQRGQAVVVPTDTVYGIGVDAFSPQAVAVLLAAKGRGRSMPPPVLVARPEVMEALAAEIPDAARSLTEAFWPGGLTVILQAQGSLAWDLGDTRGTVALRMPADELALEVLGAVGPMAVSSANRTGMPAATTAAAAESMLAESVAVYLDDGERVSIPPSTIVDCTGEHPQVVRDGTISLAELRAVVPEVRELDEGACFGFMIYFLIVLAISAVVTFVLTPPVRRLGMHLGIYTSIRARDIHTQVKPRWGGLAMYGGMVVALGAASLIPYLSGLFEEPARIAGIVGAMTLILLTGLADDAWDIHWVTKLAAQVGAATILVLSGTRLEVAPMGRFELDDGLLQAVLTVFVVVATINAFNFIDGLDGLAAGVAAIGGAAFFLYSYMLTLQLHEFTVSNLTTLLMAVLVGACLGFLPHNFHPSSVIMGDTGAMLLGTVMAAGALVVTSSLELYEESFRFMNVPAYMPVLLPLAVMVLPMLDLVMAVARRTARGHRPSPQIGATSITSFWTLGTRIPQAVLLLYMWAAIVAFGGVSFNFIPWQWVVLSAGGGLTAAAVLTFTPRFRRLIRRKGAP